MYMYMRKLTYAYDHDHEPVPRAAAVGAGAGRGSYIMRTSTYARPTTHTSSSMLSGPYMHSTSPSATQAPPSARDALPAMAPAPGPA